MIFCYHHDCRLARAAQMAGYNKIRRAVFLAVSMSALDCAVPCSYHFTPAVAANLKHRKPPREKTRAEVEREAQQAGKTYLVPTHFILGAKT